MPSRNTRRIIPFVLAVVLVLAPASFAAASPVSFNGPVVQAPGQWSVVSWVTGWFQNLLSGPESVEASAKGSGSEGVGSPAPSDDLTTESTEERDRGPTITVDG